MKILVTGGAGFIGSNLTDALIARGDEVTVVDDLSTGVRSNVNPKATFVEKSVTDPRAFDGLGKFDAVVHLAAKIKVLESFSKLEEYKKVNIEGTERTLAFAQKNAVKFVLASSCAVYGDVAPTSKGISENTPTNPQSPYAEQKLAAENLCRAVNFPTIILRFFNVYGPRMSREGAYVGAIRKFIDQKAASKPITIWGDGEQVRDYIHVADLVAAIISCLDLETEGNETFNVGSGVATPVNRLADLVAGKKYPREHQLGVKEPRWMLADTSALQKATGWEPRQKLDAFDFSALS